MGLCDSGDDARLSETYALNDTFRRSFVGGKIVTTAGVAALGAERLAHLLRLVRSFDLFDADNDPHGEHDFGMIEDQGERFLWKIDYYDAELRFGSEDPSDPAQTTRVLTLMFASEW